jgi:anthraniloyl-CoA monooxygenase
VKITCVGGGPTGLYFALLSKLRSPRAEVTVIERNPAGTTHGWGVTWGDELLDDLYGCDPVSARRLLDASLLWGQQMVRISGRPPVYLGGKYGYSMSRSRMQEILTERADELGVQLVYGQSVDDAAALDADLVVATDGVGSKLRTRHADQFGPTITTGRNRYIWLGTTKVLETFTFAFERTEAGWLWSYGYPTTGGTSTFVIECAPATWTGLGLDRLGPDAALRLLESVFDGVLSGHRLLEPHSATGRSPWVHFREIRNATWRAGNLVLAGDAAHTTHFGIGSGTVLAMQDAIALADTLRSVERDRAALELALESYDRRRRAVMGPIQDMAMRSMSWFEDVDNRMDGDPVRVAYSLFDRRGDQAPWRYQLHLATQIEPLRQVRNGLTSARRSVRGIQRSRRARVDAP